MSVLAELWTEESADEQRGNRRHSLRLEAQAIAGPEVTGVLVHNISETGLSLETTAELKMGDLIEVDLPEAPGTTARVVWASGTFYGCKFEEKLHRPAVSAARLRAHHEQVEAIDVQSPMSGLLAAYGHDAHEAAHSDELSPRTKFLVIVGSSLFLWSVILGAAWLAWTKLLAPSAC